MADQSKSIPESVLPAVEKLLRYHREERFGTVTFELKAGAIVGKADVHWREKMNGVDTDGRDGG